MAEKDMVTKPSHYRSLSGRDTIDAMVELAASHEEFRGFLKHNIIKYLIRLGKKDDAVQDAQKIVWYAMFLYFFSGGSCEKLSQTWTYMYDKFNVSNP